MNYVLEVDHDKINMEQLKKIDQLCGGGIFEETAGKITVALMQPLILVFDLILKLVEGLPFAGPLSELKDLIISTIQQGKQNIQIVTVEDIDGKMNYALNSENKFLQIFASLIRGILPFAKDYTFEQTMNLLAPNNVADTMAMMAGAMLGHYCVIENRITSLFTPLFTGMGLFGGKRVDKKIVQHGGEPITILTVVLVLGVLGIALAFVAVVLVAFVIIFLAILLFLTVVVVGLLWFFHDSIIWGITYLGNILTTLVMMIPVYLITFRSSDQESLGKALEFMKEVPLEDPYKNINEMTQKYDRSMDSFDATIGEVALSSITATQQLGTEGVGQIGQIGVAGTQIAQTGLQTSSGLSGVAEMGEQFGGFDPEIPPMTLCQVVAKAKLLDPSKAKPQDMINAIGGLKPEDFAGPLNILGQVLILLYAVIFNYDQIKGSVDAGIIKLPTPNETNAMLSRALNATPEEVKIKAEAFEQVYPKGTPISELAKKPDPKDLEEAVYKIQDPKQREVAKAMLIQMGVASQAGGKRIKKTRRYKLVQI